MLFFYANISYFFFYFYKDFNLVFSILTFNPFVTMGEMLAVFNYSILQL